MRAFYFCALLIAISACQSNTRRDADITSAVPAANPNKPSVEQVKTLFSTCAACHGNQAEGNLALNAPALVNQDAWYLVRQLQHFKVGIRGADKQDSIGQRMSAIARTLEDSITIAGIVEYIKTLPPVLTASTVKGDIQAGMSQYAMICGACHGPGAEGNLDFNAPKLTGTDDWYLERQLVQFKNGTRGSHPDDITGTQMKQIAGTLKDDKSIQDVIAYIQSLQKKSL